MTDGRGDDGAGAAPGGDPDDPRSSEGRDDAGPGDPPSDEAGSPTEPGEDPCGEKPADPDEWRAASFDAVRRLYGRARYEPAGADPETLVAALSGSERYRLTVARGIESYAGRDPDALAAQRARVVAAMDDADVARPLGRALGRLAAVDERAVDDLLDRLRGNRPVAAAEGLAIAADRAPGAVASALPSLIDALDARDEVRDPAIAALAKLYAADPAGEVDARLRIRDLIESGQRERRGAGARAMALAAAEGCSAALEVLPVVASLLERPFGGWRSAIATRAVDALVAPGPTRAAVREDVLAGLEAVAESRPGALAGLTGEILRGSYGGERDRAEAILARAGATDRAAYEALLERATPGGLTDAVRETVGADAGLAGSAAAAAAPDRVGVLVNRPEAVRAILEATPAVGHRLVEAVARERPGAVEWAVDPLLARVDDRLSAVPAGASAFDALGALAPTYPRIPALLTERMRTRSGGEWAAAVTATTGVAAVAPGAVLGTSASDGRSVGTLLVEALPDDAVGDEAAVGLAHLGIADPETVRQAGPRARDAVRIGEPRADRGIHVLASVVARVEPAETKPLGAVLLRRIATGAGADDPPRDPDRIDDGVVLLLGALCAEHDRHASHVIDWLPEASDAVRPELLRVLAEAAWPDGTVLVDHRPALATATRVVDADERAVATKALASAVGDGTPPAPAVRDRLVELLYDPDPTVRRWAAFGVGESLATGGTREAALDRLSTLEAVDDRRPTAALALVRAGERTAREEFDALERAARVEYRAIARTAVDELAGVDDPGVADALSSIRYEHADPWVRTRAASALGDEDSRRED